MSRLRHHASDYKSNCLSFDSQQCDAVSIDLGLTSLHGETSRGGSLLRNDLQSKGLFAFIGLVWLVRLRRHENEDELF